MILNSVLIFFLSLCLALIPCRSGQGSAESHARHAAGADGSPTRADGQQKACWYNNMCEKLAVHGFVRQPFVLRGVESWSEVCLHSLVSRWRCCCCCCHSVDCQHHILVLCYFLRVGCSCCRRGRGRCFGSVGHCQATIRRCDLISNVLIHSHFSSEFIWKPVLVQVSFRAIDCVASSTDGRSRHCQI